MSTKKDWSSSLCACTADTKVCCQTAVCGPCTTSNISSMLDAGAPTINLVVCCAMAAGLPVAAPLFSFGMRRETIQRFSLDAGESMCASCIQGTLCWPCSLCQVQREMAQPMHLEHPGGFFAKPPEPNSMEPMKGDNNRSILVPGQTEYPREAWSGSLCEGCGPKPCCEASLLSCCTMGFMANTLESKVNMDDSTANSDSGGKMNPAACCGAAAFGPGFCMASRRQVVQRYGKDESYAQSCCFSLFCGPCSLHQTRREMGNYREWPGGLLTKENPVENPVVRIRTKRNGGGSAAAAAGSTSKQPRNGETPGNPEAVSPAKEEPAKKETVTAEKEPAKPKEEPMQPKEEPAKPKENDDSTSNGAALAVAGGVAVAAVGVGVVVATSSSGAKEEEAPPPAKDEPAKKARTRRVVTKNLKEPSPGGQPPSMEQINSVGIQSAAVPSDAKPYQDALVKKLQEWCAAAKPAADSLIAAHLKTANASAAKDLPKEAYDDGKPFDEDCSLADPRTICRIFYDVEDLQKLMEFDLTEWAKDLPDAADETANMRQLGYHKKHIGFVMLKATVVFERVISEELSGKEKAIAHFVQPLAKAGAELDRVVQGMFAAFLYTAAIRDCDKTCTTPQECKKLKKEEEKAGEKPHQVKHLPANNAALGWDISLWSVMNWVMRLSDDPKTKTQPWAPSVSEALVLYKPLIANLDWYLCHVPHERRVVFRGISVRVAQKYKLGTEVVWPAFTSTSLNYKIAKQYMGKSGTFFIAFLHSASMIDYLSEFPHEKEALLMSNRVFKVTNKVSRTVQQMLGCPYDIVLMTETGSVPTPKEVSDAQFGAQVHIAGMYDDYVERYVEGRVAEQPTLAGTPIRRTFADWVKSEQKYLLLLGEGGAGKTSAALACMSYLASGSLNETVGKKCISLFVPLPSVPNITQKGALDTAVLLMLGCDAESVKYLTSGDGSKTYQLVLVFDSLDEVSSTDPKTELASLLDRNPLCGAAKVVLSCRQEFLALNNMLPYTACLTATDSKVATYYVKPFVMSDVKALIEKICPNPADTGLVDKSVTATQFADTLLSVIRNKLGLSDALLFSPITLKMAAEVVLKRQLTIDQHWKAFAATYKLQDGIGIDRFFLYQLYMDQTVNATFRKPLAALAHTMLKKGKWYCTVGVALETLKANGVEDPQAWIETKIPSRLEDANDPEAAFSFGHRTHGEYLAACAIWDDHKTAIGDIPLPFSLNQPGVLTFLADMARADETSVAKLYAMSTDLKNYVVASKGEQVKNPQVVAKASNSLSILCACSVLLDKFDMSNVLISKCNLTNAQLNYVKCPKAIFDECVLNGACFDDATVTDASFPNSKCEAIHAPYGGKEGSQYLHLSDKNNWITTCDDKLTMNYWSPLGSSAIETKEFLVSKNTEPICCVSSQSATSAKQFAVGAKNTVWVFENTSKSPGEGLSIATPACKPKPLLAPKVVVDGNGLISKIALSHDGEFAFVAYAIEVKNASSMKQSEFFAWVAAFSVATGEVIGAAVTLSQEQAKTIGAHLKDEAPANSKFAFASFDPIPVVTATETNYHVYVATNGRGRDFSAGMFPPIGNFFRYAITVQKSNKAKAFKEDLQVKDLLCTCCHVTNDSLFLGMPFGVIRIPTQASAWSTAIKRLEDSHLKAARTKATQTKVPVQLALEDKEIFVRTPRTVHSLAVSPSGAILVAGLAAGSVQAFVISNGDLAIAQQVHDDDSEVIAVGFHAEDIVSVLDNAAHCIKVSLKSDETLAPRVGHNFQVVDIAPLPKTNQCITCGLGKKVYVWDIVTNKLVHRTELTESRTNVPYYHAPIQLWSYPPEAPPMAYVQCTDQRLTPVTNCNPALSKENFPSNWSAVPRGGYPHSFVCGRYQLYRKNNTTKEFSVVDMFPLWKGKPREGVMKRVGETASSRENEKIGAASATDNQKYFVVGGGTEIAVYSTEAFEKGSMTPVCKFKPAFALDSLDQMFPAGPAYANCVILTKYHAAKTQMILVSENPPKSKFTRDAPPGGLAVEVIRTIPFEYMKGRVSVAYTLKGKISIEIGAIAHVDKDFILKRSLKGFNGPVNDFQIVNHGKLWKLVAGSKDFSIRTFKLGATPEAITAYSILAPPGHFSAIRCIGKFAKKAGETDVIVDMQESYEKLWQAEEKANEKEKESRFSRLGDK